MKFSITIFSIDTRLSMQVEMIFLSTSRISTAFSTSNAMG